MHRDYVRHINDTKITKIEYGNHFVSIKGHSVGWNVFDLGQILGIFFSLLVQQIRFLNTYYIHTIHTLLCRGIVVNSSVLTYLLIIVQIVHLFDFFYMVYLQLRFAFKTSFMKNSCNPFQGFWLLHVSVPIRISQHALFPLIVQGTV